MLASRSRELLKVLINTRHPVRIKDLARDFQVSERTIKYDLKSVRRWLTDQNVSLYSQPNKGIWIAEGSGKRSELLAALADAGPREIYLNQRARFQHIVLELLFCDGYLRIGELAQNLQVSRNTVVADLREAEAYLESWGLFLQRKAHYGILVSGSEWKRRLALENVIQTSLGSHDMYRLMQALLGETDQPLCPAAILRHFAFSAAEEQQIQRTMRRLLERLQRELEICLSERVLISVLIRLSISLYRLRKRHKLQAKPLPFCHDKAQQIYRVFQQELSRLGAQCGMLLPEAEMVFVCLPAMGTTLLADASADGGEPKQLDDYALTSELIEAISLRTGMPLRDDPDLAVDLLAHLSDRIRKHLNGVLDPNPLADEIKRAYPQMFAAVKMSCEQVFAKRGIRLLDSDIAYIVLHFQAACNRMQERKKVNALVVCGTGRGTARFLKTFLEQEIKGLRVVGLCSSLEVEKYLATRQVDLIVTVLPLESSLPVVTVHPLPTRQDIAAIEQLVKEWEQAAERANAGQLRRSPTAAYVRGELQERDLPIVERITQEVICQGFALAQRIVAEFREQLSEQAADGLMLHILLMVNRLSFGSPYLLVEEQTKAKAASGLRRRLENLLEEAEISLPESEISAILRYIASERRVIAGDGERSGDYEWLDH